MVPQIVAQLLEFAEVRLVVTGAARHFLELREQLPTCVQVLGDDDEWREWREIGDPVMHIELRRWADLMLIAPLSANSLAKMASGLCDNLLLSIVRAWDFTHPLLVAPAMNTLMWDSIFTAKHLAVLRQLGVTYIAPIEKTLACGDSGIGAMAAVETIVNSTKSALETSKQP